MVELVLEPWVRAVGKTELSSWDVEVFADKFVADYDASSPISDILSDIEDIDKIPEFGGRFCYRSFRRGRDSEAYINNILESGHLSVLEHASVNFVVAGISRSLSHELIRHRIGMSPSQESQRYVDAKDVRFVVPPLVLHLNEPHRSEEVAAFRSECEADIERYISRQKRYVAYAGLDALDVPMGDGGTPLAKRINEAARASLPNAAETRIFMTANLRSLRHMCSLRGSEYADLEIRRLFVAITRIMRDVSPLVFDDFSIVRGKDGIEATTCVYTAR